MTLQDRRACRSPPTRAGGQRRGGVRDVTPTGATLTGAVNPHGADHDLPRSTTATSRSYGSRRRRPTRRSATGTRTLVGARDRRPGGGQALPLPDRRGQRPAGTTQRRRPHASSRGRRRPTGDDAARPTPTRVIYGRPAVAARQARAARTAQRRARAAADDGVPVQLAVRRHASTAVTSSTSAQLHASRCRPSRSRTRALVRRRRRAAGAAAAVVVLDRPARARTGGHARGAAPGAAGDRRRGPPR